MDKREVIEGLRGLKELFREGVNLQIVLDMAIEALEQEPTAEYSSDVISRQATIDALAKEMPSLTTPDGCGEFDHDIQITDEAFVDCMQIINGLPSAQPERKKGKWIIDNKETGRIWHCHCSNCRKDPQDHIGGTENWWLVRLPKYCPNCGADMRGEEE